MPTVIIVGAGPTGATLAWLLTQRGIPVCLVEGDPQGQRGFRGQALMPSGLEVLSQMGISLEGIPTQPLSAWEFWLDHRLLFRADEPMGSPVPCTIIAQTPFLERVIAQAAATGRLQHRVGIPVETLLWQGEQVIGVTLATGEHCRGSLVVGADGGTSRIRQQGGLALRRVGKPLTVAWYNLPAPPQWQHDNVFCTCIATEQTLGLFLGADGGLHLAWVGSGEPDPATWIPVLPPALAAHLKGHPHPWSPPVTVQAQAGYCPQWWRPGLLLLGDAAHPMSPVRAQGLTMGLRDAVVAANHLVPQWGSPDLNLSGIEPERRPEITGIQRLQTLETWQGELLRTQPGIRGLISRFSSPLGSPLGRVWRQRQIPLRHGVTTVKLKV